MDSPTETRSQYESAILQQLIKNAEDLAVIKFRQEENQSKIDKIENIENRLDNIKNDITEIKNEITEIKKEISTAKGWLIAVFIGIIINIISQPILEFLQ